MITQLLLVGEVPQEAQVLEGQILLSMALLYLMTHLFPMLLERLLQFLEQRLL
jgi:hypothetical protein